MALAAFVLPTARLATVSLHLSLEHHQGHADRGHEDDVQASFHGHDHDGKSGNHQHSLVSFQPAAHRARVLKAVAFLLAWELDTARTSQATDPRWAPRTRLNDHGPPGRVSQGIILRV